VVVALEDDKILLTMKGIKKMEFFGSEWKCEGW
jgi:hypothetical protein